MTRDTTRGTRQGRNDRVRQLGVAHGVALGLTILAAMGLPSSAMAAFDVTSFSGVVAKQDGSSATQAASHPYSATTTFTVPVLGPFETDGQVKDVLVDLPPGFVANPSATPSRCTASQLYETGLGDQCPPSAQVGTSFTYLPLGPGFTVPQNFSGVYNMVPPPGYPALLGLVVQAQPVFLFPEVRSNGDYGLTVRAQNISQLVPIAGASVTVWGVPGDPSHDTDRGTAAATGDPNLPDGHCSDPQKPAECRNAWPNGVRHTAFVTNPSDCAAGPLTTTLRADSWQEPGNFITKAFDRDTNGNLTSVSECGRVPFDPQVSIQPTSHQPDAPTGLEVSISVSPDGLNNPDGLAQAPLKRAVLTLPDGMTVSPAGAAGLGACGPAQVGLHSLKDPRGPGGCPSEAKIGTVEVDTPLLEQPLEGEVYVASQQDNPFGTLLALYIVARGPGVIVKLPGRVDPDPVTGRLTATFDNNPQLPFSQLTVRLKGGPHGPLANPPDCGMKTASADLSPWSADDPNHPVSGEIRTRSDAIIIDCPGMGGFQPLFDAGTAQPVSGAFSPFTVRTERSDREEYLQGLDVRMPGGLIASLKGVDTCPSDLADQGTPGTCPVGSKIGTVTVGAGPGSDPYFIEGSVYLTGRYKDGPYGVSVQVAAKAGPFDLGVVKVRAALEVDPEDAHVTVKADPLPTILEGIPLRLRSINVDVDRPRFVSNPTSCAGKEIGAAIVSTFGSIFQAERRFKADGCRALAFSPTLGMRLTGTDQVRDGSHPGLRVRLSQHARQANLKTLRVKLPLSLALDPANAAGLCEFAEGQKRNPECPESSIVGSAVAVTPVLNRPLKGPVYFVKGIRIDKRSGRQIRTLPTLLMKLRGDVAINIRQKTSVEGNRLVATTAATPDAPVSRFDVSLTGGKHGILVASGKRGVCGEKQVARVESESQSGRRRDFAVRMVTGCGQTLHRLQRDHPR